MSRILHTSIVALVAFALLAPAALGERPDDRGGMIGVGGAVAVATTTRPDDRADTRGPGAVAATEPASVRPDDRNGVRGPGAAPTVVISTPESGFDWGDAGVGALGAFGLALVLFGALQVAAHTRRTHASV